MGQCALPKKQIESVVELLKKNATHREIAARTGVSKGSVANIAIQYGLTNREKPFAAPDPVEPENHQQVIKALKQATLSTAELADELDWSPRRVRETIDAMKQRGVLVGQTLDDRWELKSAEGIERQITPVTATTETWNHRFGVVSDNHLCNKHSRLDVLNAAYDHFEREGYTTVLHPGNWIDGEHRFTRPELIVRPGMDAQIDYMLENYPQRKGITTLYIAGDDHEGWYQQRECIEIGRYLQMRAEKIGRQDLKYLGYAEADIELKAPGGSAVGRIVHPGGGSAYAISYTDQKRVESYQGGEKPAVEFVGHYHKYNAGQPREVNTFQAGCTSDQTLFMRKKRLQAMVGFLTVEIQQDRTDGHINRLRHEWFPFFNRGFYEQRYGLGGLSQPTKVVFGS